MARTNEYRETVQRNHMTRSLPKSAQVFVGAVAAVSLVPVIAGGLQWQAQNPLLTLSLLAAAVLTSKMKVKLPGLTSTMSVNLPFLLLAIAELNLLEASLVAAAAGLAQTLGGENRPEFVKVLFNTCTLTNAAAASYVVFHHAGSEGKLTMVALWTAAAAVYFLANTIPVATIIALSSGQKASKVWSDFFMWTFPCYVLGTGVAAIAMSAQSLVNWQALLPMVAVAYGVYRSYTMYASRMEAEAPVRAMAAGAGH